MADARLAQKAVIASISAPNRDLTDAKVPQKRVWTDPPKVNVLSHNQTTKASSTGTSGKAKWSKSSAQLVTEASQAKGIADPLEEFEQLQMEQ